MKIPVEKWIEWGVQLDDMDARLFLTIFDEEPGSVLVLGAHDEPTANILTDAGFDVTGVDLREYDPLLPECNYRYLRGDFCDPDLPVGKDFDYFVSLSTVEHLGMKAYNEGGPYQRFYDVLAMRKAWERLRVGGRGYVTVPYGGEFYEFFPHWRVYDCESAYDRLVQDFECKGVVAAVSGDIEIDGVSYKQGSPITWESINNYKGPCPHISLLLSLEKIPVTRIAPDGR